MSTSSSTSPLVLVLVGPTASGKTALLDALFGFPGARASRGLPEAVVLSADSMQAYRGMDIGTAKPDRALLSRLPHRLIDIKDVKEQYTAGEFVALADFACEEAWAAGRLPIVSGGTGFYVRNFICGLPSGPAAEPGIRAQVAADLEALGPGALRAELASADPASAARIHERDLYRLTRALEIVRATGRPMADFAPSDLPRAGYRFALFGVERPREELAARIAARVGEMMDSGLAAEVASLVASGAEAGDPGMQAIGYREFFDPSIRGSVSPGGLAAGGDTGGAPAGGAPGTNSILPGDAAVAEAIVRDTRRYAKRQMTFFRKLPGIRWIPPEPDALAEGLRAFLR